MEQKKFEYQDVNYDNHMNTNNCGCNMNMDYANQYMSCPPIQECPQEKVCHRYMCYEVPHIIPCNTRIINHHVYRHTYTPYYTTCEENVVSNVYDRNCC